MTELSPTIVSRPSVAIRRGLVVGGRIVAIAVLLGVALAVFELVPDRQVPWDLMRAWNLGWRFLFLAGSLTVAVTLVAGRVRRTLPPRLTTGQLLAGVGLAWVSFIVTNSISSWMVYSIPPAVEAWPQWRTWMLVELAVRLVTGLAAIYVIMAGAVRIQRAASVAVPADNVSVAV